MGVYEYPQTESSCNATNVSVSPGKVDPDSPSYKFYKTLFEPVLITSKEEKMDRETRHYRLGLAGIISGAAIVAIIILSVMTYNIVDRITPGVLQQKQVQYEVVRPQK